MDKKIAARKERRRKRMKDHREKGRKAVSGTINVKQPRLGGDAGVA